MRNRGPASGGARLAVAVAVALAACGDDPPERAADDAPAATAAARVRATDEPAAPAPAQVTDALLSGATVQTGTLASTSDGVQTVIIAAVDPARSFLLFSTRHNSADPDSSLLRGRIASATTLEFARVSNDANPIDVRWYVVSYPAGVRVQRGEVTQSATTVNVTLPQALGSTARAFVTYSKTAASSATTVDSTVPVLATLTTASNLQLRVNTAAAAHVIWWQVVEFLNAADVDVQRGVTSIAGNATSTTVTLPVAVDVTRTFVLVSFRTAGTGNDVGRRMIRAQLASATTITIDRGAGGNGDDLTEIAWQAVHLKDGSTVQRGTAAFAVGAASATATLAPVTLGKTAAFSGAQGGDGQSMGRSTYTSGDVLGVGAFTLGLTATQLAMQRNNTAGAADLGWYVVQFGTATAVCGDGVREGAEQCDGSACCTAGCTFSAAGAAHAACTDLTPADCQVAACDGAGTCAQTQAAAADGAACGDGVCNQCTAGTCGASAAGAPGPGCTGTAGECSIADVCDGAGACATGDLAAGTACTDATPTDCRLAQCTGTGTCNQTQGTVANGAGCGDGVCDQCSAGACVATAAGVPGPGCAGAANDCSTADACDGGGACTTGDFPAGTACTDLTPTDCRAAQCSGAGSCNQAAVNRADGIGCGDGVCNQCASGSCVASAAGAAGPGCTAGATGCSAADTCNGGGACQPNHLGANVVCDDTTPTDCRDARCDGGGGCDQLATAEPDGTACPAGTCGAGTCEPLRAQGAACAVAAQCASGFCADGFCCDDACTASCDTCAGFFTQGTCTTALVGMPGDPSCAPYACGGDSAACPTSCTWDFECAATGYCTGGACASKGDDGAACSAANQCLSGHCVEGVCCNGPCGGACDTCASAAAPGVCSPAGAGAPGAPSCLPFVCNGATPSCPLGCASDLNCAPGHFCDGGACVARLAIGQTCGGDNQCASDHCVDGVCCGSACDGACEACDLDGSVGQCVAVPDGTAGAPSCTPYVCDGVGTGCPSTCATSDDCVLTSLCDLGACQPPTGLANGAACGVAAECLSAFCVDGVCCDGACGEPCDACNLAGSAGTCTIAPDGAPGGPSCSPNTCGGAAACGSTCATDADCAPGFACTDGICGVTFVLGQSWSEGQLLDPQNPSAKSLIHVETATEARFHVHAAAPDVDVVFYDPADRPITYASTPAGMAYSRWSFSDESIRARPGIETPLTGPGYHVLLRVANPTPGLWTVKTTALAPPAGPMALRVSLDTNGGPGLSLVTDKDAYTVGQPIRIFAHLRNTAASPPSPITGGTVTASFLQFIPSDGQTVQRVPDDPIQRFVALRDDAGGGDAVANDGVYTGVVTMTTAGSYMLGVEARGNDALGRPFQRGAGKDVRVQGAQP